MVLRFLPEGPSIPDELLVARDEGRVVSFCGAGCRARNRHRAIIRRAAWKLRVSDAEIVRLALDDFGERPPRLEEVARGYLKPVKYCIKRLAKRFAVV